MSEKLSVDGFEWVEVLSKIDKDFIKNYDEDSNVGYFILNIQKNCIINIVIYHSYLKELKLINVKS